MLRAGLVVILLPALGVAEPIDSPDSVAVARLVLDIISYTNWPEEPPALHLCVLAAPRWAGDLLDHVWVVHGHRVVSDRPILPALAECDITYTGAMSDAERRALSERLVGHAVLSITESDPDCAVGSMFCVTVIADRPSFMVNLDATARSGLRVNPLVLQLGRDRHRAPSSDPAR